MSDGFVMLTLIAKRVSGVNFWTIICLVRAETCSNIIVKVRDEIMSRFSCIHKNHAEKIYMERFYVFYTTIWILTHENRLVWLEL